MSCSLAPVELNLYESFDERLHCTRRAGLRLSLTRSDFPPLLLLYVLVVGIYTCSTRLKRQGCSLRRRLELSEVAHFDIECRYLAQLVDILGPNNEAFQVWKSFWIDPGTDFPSIISFDAATLCWPLMIQNLQFMISSLVVGFSGKSDIAQRVCF